MAYPTISGGSYGINENNINETPSGTVNGSNTDFTLANTPVSGSEQVYRDGQLMKGGGDDYSISGTTITFTTAPVTGSVLLVTYKQAINASGNADTVDGIDASGFIAAADAPTGDIVGTSDTQTLTNKTLTSPTINTPTMTYGDSAPVRGCNFKAYMSTAQNMTSANTYYTCQLDSEFYDVGGDFNTSTYQFTCPTTGYYLISFKIAFVNSAASDQLYAALFKNTSTNICRVDHESGTAGSNSVTHTSIYYLASGDTLEIKASNVNSAGKGIGNGTHATTFGGVLIST